MLLPNSHDGTFTRQSHARGGSDPSRPYSVGSRGYLSPMHVSAALLFRILWECGTPAQSVFGVF